MFKSPWKQWVLKLEKTMLMTTNINSNSKNITSTNSHINIIFLLEKQNPFNERTTSCASFIIKWIIAIFITKVPREKQNGCWVWSISNDNDWHDCSQAWGIRHLLNVPINFEHMTLFHYWIVVTFVKSFGDGTNL
jgi:hypothetical protein